MLCLVNHFIRRIKYLKFYFKPMQPVAPKNMKDTLCRIKIYSDHSCKNAASRPFFTHFSLRQCFPLRSLVIFSLGHRLPNHNKKDFVLLLCMFVVVCFDNSIDFIVQDAVTMSKKNRHIACYI